MLNNSSGQNLITDNTVGSIQRNTRGINSNNPTDIGDRPRLIVDAVIGNLWTYRTTTGDTSQNYLNLSNSWYQSYLGALTVEQRQELTTLINTNAASGRKRWTYS